ncbi:MAG: hypothetical protein QOJ16_4425 [Acidobacteriota bacterium]|nr:hypothetical protein [Acidobacteriota bacterium]
MREVRYTPGSRRPAPTASGLPTAKEGILTRRQRLPGRLATIAVGIALFAAMAALPEAVRAQELYTYTVGVLGGVGGSPDASPGSDLGNHSFQVNLGLVTEPKTVLTLRLGRLSLDRKSAFGSLTGADLTYADIGGEYRFDETYYQSGVYIALGAYRLQGKRAFDGSRREQTAVGAALGLTGEFPLNSHFGILIELSGHYTPLNEAKTFAMGHAGVAFHF